MSPCVHQLVGIAKRLNKMSIDCFGPLFKILAKFLFWT